MSSGKKILYKAANMMGFTSTISEISYENNVNVTPTTLKISLIRTNNLINEVNDRNTTLIDLTINISEISKIPNIKPNSFITIGHNYIIRNSLDKNVLINLSSSTYVSRTFNPYASKQVKIGEDIYPFLLFVKDPNVTSFDDIDIIIPGNTFGNITFTSNATFTDYTSAVYASKFPEKDPALPHLQEEDFLDTITITKDTSYVNADYSKYTVSTESYIDVVLLEQVIGIPDRLRVDLIDGTGSFRVLKSSVDNKFAVKAGFGYYTNIKKYEE
jgi:hypothetical protein